MLSLETMSTLSPEKKQSPEKDKPAPFKDHDDEELLLKETLVGRTTPYVVPKSLNRFRRRYY